jgi:PAS domain S-box-containing protein
VSPGEDEDEATLVRRLEGMSAETKDAARYLQELATAMFPGGPPTRAQLTWADRRDRAEGADRRIDAESRLRAAEARFRTLVEQIPAVTFMAVLGEGQNEVYVSPHIEAMLGFTQKQWLSDPLLWYSQLHPDDRELWNAEFARGCRSGGPFRAECRFLARDGHVVWVHGEARLVRDDLGRPAYLQGVAFDITEAKRAQEVLLNEAVVTARLEEELALARRIQTSILPRSFAVDGLDIAAVMVPASDVGGDYYEVLPVPGGAWIGIGDVAGHGLSAGLVMLMVQSATAALAAARPDATPREIIATLNQVLFDNVRRRLGQDHHVTFTLLRYRFTPPAGRFSYAGAHEEMIIRRVDGRIELVTTPGPWLAAAPHVDKMVTNHMVELHEGDLLVLLTDGVTEAMDRERQQFGQERVVRILNQHHTSSVQVICEAVLAGVRAWAVEPQEDDISIVVVRQRGA